MNTPVITHSPGKLILSGEHAIVHGAPALAVAVNRYAQVNATPLPRPEIEIVFPGEPVARLPISRLAPHLAGVEFRHNRFLDGRLSIRDVTPTPAQLLFAACGRAEPTSGWRLEVLSDIPIGSGLGSSAAVLLGVLKVLLPDAAPNHLYREALACEHYQHGRSSGLDVYTSLHGGMITGTASAFRKIPGTWLPPFRVMNTGRPQTSTGECVSVVRQRFPHSDPIWRDFVSVTTALRTAVENRDAAMWRESLLANHRLLCTLGVVPEPVQDFVKQVEAQGGAAKICGAGSVKGPYGGMLLVSAPGSVPPPESWTSLDLGLATRGTHREPES